MNLLGLMSSFSLPRPLRARSLAKDSPSDRSNTNLLRSDSSYSTDSRTPAWPYATSEEGGIEDQSGSQGVAQLLSGPRVQDGDVWQPEEQLKEK